MKELISYNVFSKLDIAIGTILSVEVVEDAYKLLKLSVDVGETESDGVTLRPRQIISGIREFFEDPEFLVGKQCPFVLNLEPRVIRGFESQGMILASNAGDVLALLNPHQALPPGTRVS